MNFQKLIFLGCIFMLVSVSTQGQDKAFYGKWELTDSPAKDKCAQDQLIELRKDGTASYYYAMNTKNCKGQTMEYKTWKVKEVEVKVKVKNATGSKKYKTEKKKAIIIGKYQDIVFYVLKKSGSTMVVSGQQPDGDTTKPVKLTFKKQK